MTLRIIDRYTLGARVFPACVATASLFLAASAWFPVKQWAEKLGGGSLVFVIAAFALAQLVREKGKAIEARLWDSWGEPPTVRLLRHRDRTFDPGTKARMHRRLIDLGVVDHMPSDHEEAQDLEGADMIYRTCSEWARRKALELRKSSPFDVVHDENISYGYYRNLLGIRKIGLAIASVSVVAIGTAFYFGHMPIVEIAVSLVLFAYMAAIVNETRAKHAAENYAHRLLSAIDALPTPAAKTKSRTNRTAKGGGATT